MNYQSGRSSAASLFPCVLAMRLFWGLSVDFPFAMNASWMCVILGFMLFVPFGYAINQVSKISTASPWEYLCSGLPRFIANFLQAGLGLLLVFDASVVARLTASSSNIIALNNVTVHLLSLPLAVVVAIVIMLGSDALGKSSRIWLYTLPVLFLVILTVQIGALRIGWITPLLGGGLEAILSGSFYCAGNMALTSLIWMVAVPDRNQRGILRYTGIASAVVAVLMLVQHMSFPSMINIPFTRAARIELILSNGRMSLTPQLFLNVVWYGGLLYLLSAEAVTAASFFRLSYPKVPVWVLGILISAAVLVMTVFNPDWMQNTAAFTGCLYALLGFVVASLLLVTYLRRRKEWRE